MTPPFRRPKLFAWHVAHWTVFALRWLGDTPPGDIPNSMTALLVLGLASAIFGALPLIAWATGPWPAWVYAVSPAVSPAAIGLVWGGLTCAGAVWRRVTKFADGPPPLPPAERAEKVLRDCD